jgi:membrane protease YdiL (CAAX protease family)
VFDDVADPSYLAKQLLRIPFLVVIPYLWLRHRNPTNLEELRPKRVTFRDVRISVWSGLVVYVGAIGGYAIIYLFSDASSITTELMATGITRSNILYVGIYMSFVNAYVEEFFFRGVLHQPFQDTSPIKGYLVTSGLWALFHLGIVSVYFEPLLLISLLIGMMIVGSFLVFVNRYGRGLMNSYLVHVFADLAMFSIGLYLYFR